MASVGFPVVQPPVPGSNGSKTRKEEEENVLIIPFGRVHDLAFKCAQARNLRPGYLVQLPTTGDHDMSCIFKGLSRRQICHSDVPIIESRVC